MLEWKTSSNKIFYLIFRWLERMRKRQMLEKNLEDRNKLNITSKANIVRRKSKDIKTQTGYIIKLCFDSDSSLKCILFQVFVYRQT